MVLFFVRFTFFWYFFFFVLYCFYLIITKPLYSSTMLPLSDTYRPSRNYRIISQMLLVQYKRKRKQSYLSNILVPDSANLLDIGSALRNTLKGVSENLELILDIGGSNNLNTRVGRHTANVLLAQKVSIEKRPLAFNKACFFTDIGIPDLNIEKTSLTVLLNVHVDGKVSVDVTHLVLEAPGNTNDQVVDDSADRTEGSNTLTGTMVKFDRDYTLLRATESDGDVGEVLDECA